MSALAAAAAGRELWYLTRATGLVTLVLLTGTVALGVASTGAWERTRWPRFVTQGLHRNLSMLAVSFLFVHVLTTVVDGFVPIDWANAVVPFTSPYRRVWLGLGALSCDLILALVLTSAVRRHLPAATWRGVHWLAYLSWPVALMHGLGTGTDATTTVMRAVTAACMALVAGSVLWRLAHRFPAGRRVRAAGALALLLALLGGALGLDGGLLPPARTLLGAPAPLSSGPTTTAAPTPPAPVVPPTTPPGPVEPPAPAASPVPAPAPAPVEDVSHDDALPAPTTVAAPPAPPPTTALPAPTPTTTAPAGCETCDDGG